MRYFVLLALLFHLLAVPRAESAPGTISQIYPEKSYLPTDQYWIVDFMGWKVYVNPGVFEREDVWKKFVTLFNAQLVLARQKIPEDIFIEIMHSTAFWIELNNNEFPRAVAWYHVGDEWLKQFGYNPDKAAHIEITNLELFFDEAERSSSLLFHMFLHAYHHKLMPQELSNAIYLQYLQILSDGRYERVPHIDGSYQRAIARENSWKYFAELTEAYLGSNDFYPFVRADIAAYDPAMMPILRQIWGG